ncbi:probable pathogenesis-related protein ARB_02861 [Anopheles arabiensis]|uniref:probable pathogenesis-related protein ARB_02861 n=1 Tax=Anopheles arabiensis TaxID=7173 RepID=UPI001AAD8AD3|nr:probable pathogenesis-related protein ARB_02861 [Anopheles arabiensis]
MKKRKKTIYISDEVVLAFIDCVFRHEAVWNRQHPEYKNIHHRNDEWNDIAAEMDQPIDELKEKWASLQSIYRKYRSKLNRSMVTGSGADEIDHPRWFAFAAMSFLDATTDCGNTVNTLSHLEIEVLDEALTPSPGPSCVPSPQPGPSRVPSPRPGLSRVPSPRPQPSRMPSPRSGPSRVPSPRPGPSRVPSPQRGRSHYATPPRPSTPPNVASRRFKKR